ncbi:hypothetical protein [Tenacibaculum finnmarkense]|uniref:hypothetical protein n=1 Tax=Tenacibaculum finnmarkense TaxID=2781243 RepID=UPI001E63B292|nr:hypothetical protein [Tenacibaculum finnmarkense]MCD8411766.1 hypothetical protein [Tenacibaculum finnmarkense genomovar ulcerans]MCD8454569.1 hypothetical protein [Tenacibaculum finnmarkense genomovar ulcerans]MCG8249225.1 hypothetical protein [Tenacibaculum finnmarkense genomovar finnmarkense]MCG8729524.1 hypothetical protein [Tenacibaculum finnmarkense]MCG8734175.1 hypothetical protein [Tenacibaculum finnmarkense]
MSNNFLTFSTVAGSAVVSDVVQNPVPVVVTTVITLLIELFKWLRVRKENKK